MKYISWLLSLSLFLNLLFVNEMLAQNDVQSDLSHDYKDGEILVKFKKNRISLSTGVGRGLMSDIAESNNLEVEEVVSSSNLVKLIAENGESTQELISILENDPNIEFVEPNFYRHLFQLDVPNDLSFSDQWHLNNTGQSSGTPGADIDWLLAYDFFKDLELNDVVVAVIDSGVNYEHPDIANKMWDGSEYCSYASNFNALDIRIETECPNHGWDFIDNDNTPFDEIDTNSNFDGHGTHVAGLIAAEINNEFAVTGVSKNSHIMAVRVFGTSGTTTLDKIILGLDFAIQNGAHIINSSYGGGSPSQSERTLIENFDGILVAAAGNFSANNDVQEVRNVGGQNVIVSPQYPASYDLPNIISVASTTRNDGLSNFSNFGLRTVDLAAPGSNIVSIAHTYDVDDVNSPTVFTRSGTSFSAPIVAGATSVLKGIYPSLNSTDIKYAITEFGDSIIALTNNTKSGRRLNLYNSIIAIPKIFVAGFDIDNVIPASQVQQNSINQVTVNFKLRSFLEQDEPISVDLASFEYKVGNGQYVPVNDSSDGLQLNLAERLVSENDFTETFSFSFNPRNTDLVGLNNLNNQLVQVRFRPLANDTLGPYVVTEPFLVNTFVAPPSGGSGGGGGGSSSGGGGGGGGASAATQNNEVINSNLPDSSIERALFNNEKSNNSAFSDVVGHWALEYVNELFARGVVQGRSPGVFAPDNSLTRAEMVKIALESFGYELATSFQPVFPDVNSQDWFALYLVTARNSGIVSGYPDGTFQPNNPISRVEALKILLEASKLSIANVPPSNFEDVARGQWFTTFVDFAFNRGIVSGKRPGVFAPSDNVTRAEMAKMAVLTLRIVENN